ncbi:ThuA domain-containing protein [Pseudonocardia humida]|uniref:ThuA domain-containing protein n=1 Tax=Pseudonocardia humida TaxID=2800819 RepID=A0ABT1AAT4_9PSEU|nr:ThuA domain-containing protein [Pseudonocardia humida]MCO1659749.1 ThuA domain-containing protein [Pseudonocardia humida]
MGRVLVVSGTGRYADPWHPFAATSAAVAEVAEEVGAKVRIADDVDAALSGLGDVDLLVVNAGDSRRNVPEDAPLPDAATLAAAREASEAFVDRGGALLGLHTAAASLSDYPALDARLGIAWVPGTSWHPALGPARVRITEAGTTHPVTRELRDFTVLDERYTDLLVARPGSAAVLAEHAEAGGTHPLVVAREERGRVVYDALGHDLRSYADGQRRRLLARELRWLLGA